MKRFWKLAIVSSIGSICVVLGVILHISVMFQILLLTVGLVLSIIGLINIVRYMFLNQNE